MWKSASAMGSVWSRLIAVSLLNVSSKEPNAPDASPSPAATSAAGAATVSSSIGWTPESCSTTTIASSGDGACIVDVTENVPAAISSASSASQGRSMSSTSSPLSRFMNQISRPITATTAAAIPPQILRTYPRIRSTNPLSLPEDEVETTSLGVVVMMLSATSSTVSSAATVSSASSATMSSIPASSTP